MRYLFFDIECADGNRAICEFGYVMCDEHLNVMKRQNILINPECEISLTGREKQADLILTYPKEEYLKHDPFDDAYDNIKYLMTQRDILIFGHAAENDIRYLIKDINRYKLEKFDFSVYDVQKMLPAFDKKNARFTSLDKAFINLVPKEERDKLQNHRAVDDSMKTMLELKAMLSVLDLTVPELLDLCPKSKVNALEYWKKFKHNKKQRDKRRSPNYQQKIKEGKGIWAEFCRKCKLLLKDPNILGRIVAVNDDMTRHHNEFKNLISVMENNNYVGYPEINGSDYLVVYDDENRNDMINLSRRPYAGKIVTYQEFINFIEANK